MKYRHTLLTLVLTTVFTVLASPLYAHQKGGPKGDCNMMGSMHGMQHGDGMGMHHRGAMGGFDDNGMGGMMGRGMGFAMLDLSDEQLDQLDQIHDQQRKQRWEIKGKMMDEQSQLRKLYRADTPDAKAIGEVYGRICDYRRQMIEARIEAHNKKQALLTDEQRKQYQNLRHHRGHGEMMGLRMGEGMGYRSMMGGDTTDQ
ncbi:MAG: Spy/CpxP family protein refolding chaperone [Gammaproteobacteria bacterium]|nr:Spy/CpxP family protein refolding chaperone [Gammaproteobacteria bacterium]